MNRDLAYESAVLPVFNTEELVARLGGNASLVPRFLGIFERNITGYLESLRRAIDSGDIEQVRLHAHAIKGTAANISAYRMKETAAAIEVMAREGRRSEWCGRMTQLELDHVEFNRAALKFCESRSE